MKKILFPTDFSDNAENALKYTIGLTASLKADLILFHSWRADAHAFQMLNEDISEEAIMMDSLQKLEECRMKTITEAKNIKVDIKAEYGFAVDKIVEAAEAMKADLIVMGTKGASGIEGVLLGSNTAAVMERAKCPVLAIPEQSHFSEIKQIVFATDFRENDIEAILYLTGIASLFDSNLKVVHIADSMVPVNYESALLRVFETDIRNKTAYKKIEFEIIKGKNTTRALNDYIKEKEIDLVAVSTRRKNVFTRIFDSSFTKKLAYHSIIPVMAFHPHGEEQTD
jgi:nucleotide-binding universal stress UspA family protein